MGPSMSGSSSDHAWLFHPDVGTAPQVPQSQRDLNQHGAARTDIRGHVRDDQGGDVPRRGPRKRDRSETLIYKEALKMARFASALYARAEKMICPPRCYCCGFRDHRAGATVCFNCDQTLHDFPANDSSDAEQDLPTIAEEEEEETTP